MLFYRMIVHCSMCCQNNCCILLRALTELKHLSTKCVRECIKLTEVKNTCRDGGNHVY
jgi:hypothetical protein